MEDNPVFSMRKLLESTCDDRELAAQVVEVFFTDIPMQLDALDTALDARDAKAAERIAHSIKGASATVGGELLRAAAQICEQLGRDGMLDELRENMADLRTRFENLCNALRREGFASE